MYWYRIWMNRLLMSDDSVDNSTTLDPTDAPPHKRQEYRRHRRNNQPGQNGKWRDETVHIPKDRRNVFDAIAGQLELTSYQKERSRHLLGKLPDDHFRANPTKLVCFVVAGHVGVEDGRDYHPRNLLRNKKNQYAEQAEALGIGYSELISCWYRVAQDL